MSVVNSDNESLSEESSDEDADPLTFIFPPINANAEPEAEPEETTLHALADSLLLNETVKPKPNTRYNDPVYTSLIGQANLSLAHRNFKEALALCERAIRLGPQDPQPYQIMSEVYEECEEHNKALKLGMIAANLDNRDADTWIALGEKAVDLEMISDAIFCYQNALKISPHLLSVYETLLKLYNPEKDKKQIISIYQRLVSKVPPVADLLKHARTGAEQLLAENDLAGALALMEKAFEKCASFVTFDDVNLIVELYISLQKFSETLQIISRFCDVVIEAEEDIIADPTTEEVSNSTLRVISCTVTAELPIQLRTKLIIVLIRLKANHLVDGLLTPMLPLIEEYGDVFIDIIEVFMSEFRYDDAVKLLRILTNSKNFNKAQVWFLYAESLKNLNRKEEAVSAYLTVMDLAPQLSEARLVVSELLNELGRSDEALSALTQDPDSEFFNADVLYERCLLLKNNPERVDEFLVAGRLLLSRHCERFRNRKEFIAFLRFKNSRRVPKREGHNDLPSGRNEFELLHSLAITAFEKGDYPLVQRLACSGLTSRIIMNPATEKDALCLAILSAYFNRDSYTGHALLKQLIHSGEGNTRIWNVFNQLISEIGDVPQHKYITRLLKKFPCHNSLATIFGNHCFISGSYKQALSEYLLQFKNQPRPLQALLVSITFLQLALQKHATGINAFVTQALGFISEYKQLRGEAGLQEAHYNLGRLNQQLNLLPAAVHHYKMALETPAPVEELDLKREAAYNLSLIYSASNSFALARYYIEKYIVIE